MQHQKTGGGHENPNGIRRGVSSNNRPMQQRSADHHALVGQSNIGNHKKRVLMRSIRIGLEKRHFSRLMTK